ncbi:hypothetical protein ACIQI7_08835 [Kitasatospora sp. NPDC092039]|uniref:hypothetical protein n=1 Tax=Kitasatospora sp. NPDC092039 TaxID=3364086 RepID=UPI00381DEDC7
MPALHELADQRRLPDHQVMDRATLEWIASHRPPIASGPASALPPGLHVVVPAEDWFADPTLADGLHGMRHNARVSVLAQVLAARHHVDAEATLALAVAAAVHDCRRLDDRTDAGHGERAARWLSEQHGAVTTFFRLPDLTGQLLAAATTAIALHDLPASATPPHRRCADPRARTVADLLAAADALDRYRLPALRWWPDPARVRTPLPKAAHALAFRLVLDSEHARLDGASHSDALHHALDRPTREQQ